MIDEETISKVTEQMFEEAPSEPAQEPVEQPQQAQPIDYYQAQQNAAYDASHQHK